MMPRDGRATPPDDHDIAELPGTLVPRSHVEHCFHRYHTARCLTGGDVVLEVACGAGQGLGHLAAAGRRVVGGDYVERNLRLAERRYGDRIPLVRFDAHALPFADRSVDSVVIMEAIYLLDRPDAFVLEARRVLRPGGSLLVQSTNPAWRDFHPYRHARRYFDSAELERLLASAGFDVKVWAAFPTAGEPGSSGPLSMLRRVAWALRLMPRPGPLKDLLRRAFYGPLVPFPAEVMPAMAGYAPLVAVPAGTRESDHVYLYAVGTRADRP